jgi:dipeptidyl aminopeptidase/acylaminoacyl peptidase
MPLPLLLAALTVCAQPIFAQPKPPVDSTAISRWPRLEAMPAISADGQYVAYSTREPPADAITTIRATHGSWKKVFAGSARCWFPAGGQLALLTRQDTLHILRLGTDSDRVEVSVSSFQWDGAVQWWMQLHPQCSAGGNWLFFSIPGRVPETKPPNPDPAIWGYLDKTLRAAKDNPAPATQKIIQTVISRDGRHFRRLETLVTPPAAITGDYAVIRSADRYQLLSLTDGGLLSISTQANNFSFSPTGRWLVFYDPGRGQYLSCETRTGIVRTITNHLPRSVSSDHPHNIYPQAVAEPAGWLQGDSAVLLYDNWDLWAIDPAGKRRPINLTRGYGYTHQTKLRLISEDQGRAPSFSPYDTLWLTGFNIRNKYNGFFRVAPGAAPECLTMGPYTYYRVESQKPHRFSFDDGMPPQRSADGNAWIVKRESATEAPNYFLSTDLRSFEPLTHFAPQLPYNWLSSELIRFIQLDGSPGQGILYKPGDFDPTKRYPLIVNIYEQYSHRLYEFPQPGLTHDNLNIPWFVSRGYLVFTPDIDYQPASRSNKTTGQWAYNAVVAAVKKLSSIAYIDPRHIGIQAHSLGAGELNYLITHTHCFAAAAEIAGPTDAVSDYLSLSPTGNYPTEDRENQQIWESGQARIGATLWQRPDLYLRESAVLHADQITTPVLIVHNKQDGAVPWRQGVELYLALRRLRKPVWLLQYREENHSLFSDRAAMDYTRRLVAFFDHYLKGQATPDWMDPAD